MASAASVRDAWGERLPRRIGVRAATAFLVTSTIGAGIFQVPSTVAREVEQPGPALLLWVVGAVITYCGALSLAELSAALPRSGGLFAIIFEAYGRMPAFVYAWSELVVIGPASTSAVASIFAKYLNYFVPLSEWQMRLVAAGALLASGILNYVGIRPAAVVNNLTSAAKFGGLFVLCLLAFTAGSGSTAHFAPAFTGPVSASVLLTALVAVMFSYDGWADVIRIAGEIENPGRNLPRALLLGTVLITAIYLTANLAYLYLVPLSEMAGSELIAATAAVRIAILGSRGAPVIAALVMISCLGNVAAGVTSYPRTQFAIADRGEFFRLLARVSPRFQTPSVAIAIFTLVSVLYVLSGTFQVLAERFILGLWPFYVLLVTAVFLLRRNRPTLPRPYLVWGYPAVPILFLLASAALILNALWTEPVNTGITFAIVLAGAPAYSLWRALAVRRAPKHYA